MWLTRICNNNFKTKRVSRCIIILAVLIVLSKIYLSWLKPDKMAERMAARRRHLKRECSKTGLDSPEHNASSWEFLVNRQYHIIWCNVFKAASTSWMYNFNLMANYTEKFLNKTKIVPVQLARFKYLRLPLDVVQKAQNDSITFMIVRHPFERLASAYKDKIVDAVRRTYHYKKKLYIIKKYRKKLSTEERIDRKRIQRRRSRLKDQNNVDRETLPKEKYPVFEEFVSYVLDEAKENRPLDMHWTPYTTFCTPCKINFDLILKFETLGEDQMYLIKVAHLEDVVKIQWKNRRNINQSYVRSLYSRISRQQLDGLYDLYKYDFQLFNYSIDSYYELTARSMKNN